MNRRNIESVRYLQIIGGSFQAGIYRTLLLVMSNISAFQLLISIAVVFNYTSKLKLHCVMKKEGDHPQTLSLNKLKR